MSDDTSRAMAITRDCIEAWRPETFSIAFDGPPTEAPDESDGYVVEWEMKLEPSSPTACPLELWFAVGCCPAPACVAFGFDRRSRLAARLRLSSHSSAFVFGVEPVTVTPAQLRAIMTAVYEGRVEARYFSAFGRMFGVSGRLLVDVGLPHLRRSRLGSRYRYSGYAPA
jgi:hypothetical protein